MLDFTWLGQPKRLVAIGTQTVPGIPFPVPVPPAGISPQVGLQAIAALQKAATACPSIAAPNGPLQHAAMAFATFAAVSVSLQGTGEESLATLEEQLDAMCPAWRTAVPGQAPATPSFPPFSHPLSGLLNQLVLLLGAAASTGDLSQLPALAQQATGMGLPKTSEQITRLVENPPVAPDETAPPPEEPPPASEKKGMGGAAVIAVVLIAGTVLFFAVK